MRAGLPPGARPPRRAPRLALFIVAAAIAPEDLSIFDIAVEFDQDITALIKANPGLPDLLLIPAGTQVKVFARGQAD